ncbi:MAG: glycosyltransferase family 4 protein [Chloroflexi bacterium]|nr:glycosyltransferase family 4 protein [Chloroflexota bacterium]
MNQIIIIFILLTILSCVLVYLIRCWVVKGQLLDHPNDRSMHSAPIPRGGGLAIVVIVLGTALVSANETDVSRRLIYIVCGSVVAWMGWWDDVKSLSPKIRFAVQGIIAVVSIIGMGYFKAVTIPMFGELQLGVFGIVITFLWIVGLTNAYNFMDGIDGIAGGVALAAGLGWMSLTYASGHWGNSFVFWIALSIAAGSLGFLGHNWSPAKIFMGDVASTFLGYSFAVLPLLSAEKGGDALMLGTLLLWSFIMDAGLTFLHRLFKGEKIFSAHRSHLFQRLVIGGYKHSTVSSLYILLTLFAGFLSYVWARGHQIAAPFIFLGLPLIWIFLSRHASKLKNVD